MISLTNTLETWDNKFHTVLHGANPLPDQDWIRFYSLLDDWIVTTEEIIEGIGTTQREEERNQAKPHTRYVLLLTTYIASVITYVSFTMSEEMLFMLLIMSNMSQNLIIYKMTI